MNDDLLKLKEDTAETDGGPTAGEAHAAWGRLGRTPVCVACSVGRRSGSEDGGWRSPGHEHTSGAIERVRVMKKRVRLRQNAADRMEEQEGARAGHTGHSSQGQLSRTIERVCE